MFLRRGLLQYVAEFGQRLIVRWRLSRTLLFSELGVYDAQRTALLIEALLKELQHHIGAINGIVTIDFELAVYAAFVGFQARVGRLFEADETFVETTFEFVHPLIGERIGSASAFVKAQFVRVQQFSESLIVALVKAGEAFIAAQFERGQAFVAA